MYKVYIVALTLIQAVSRKSSQNGGTISPAFVQTMIFEKINNTSEVLCPENANVGKNKFDILSLDELIKP